MDDRALGLALFEAEECLARGAADKALVLASKAVKDRPESLTARSLVDRARRELLRGRRREKLEARVGEARALFERGEFAGAERIVTSALKLIPDHPVALELFGRLKGRRLEAGTVEAEAERELEALARAQALRALDAARADHAAGRIADAVRAARRGLRHVPDEADLLALLRELQQAAAKLEAERSRRNALAAQIRAGLELLEQGRNEESLKILRAVLREDPDNARAQAAIQEARQVLLPAKPPAPVIPPVAAAPATPAPQPAPLRLAPEPPPARPFAEGRPAPTPPTAEPRPPSPPQPLRPPSSSSGVMARAAGATRPSAVPVEIMLPRTRRRATPMGLVLGGGLLLAAVVVFMAGRSGNAPVHPVPRAEAPAEAPRPAQPSSSEPVSGPLAGLDPRLRSAIEATLAAYARALESADAAKLENARPDMSPSEREQRLAPFRGALNAATDIRVLEVRVEGDGAVVPILSTDVIVGGKGGSTTPLEETLRFERRDGVWALRSGARGGEAGGPGGGGR